MSNWTHAAKFSQALGSEERPLRVCSEDVLPRNEELLGEGAFGYVVAAQMSMFGEQAVAVKVSKATWNAALIDEISSMLLVQGQGTCPEVLGVVTGSAGVPAFVWHTDAAGAAKVCYVEIVGFVMAKATICLIDACTEKPWEYSCLVSMFLEMAYRTRELEEAGILHLDIKPENFLVTDIIQSDGSMSRLIQVSDFGMAKLLTNGKCVCHTACGTPEYQAPEVARATHLGVEVDSKADVFSLGATMWALAGSGQCQQWLSQYPGADTLTEIISDCMSEDPDARPPMTEVIAVLERVERMCQSMAEEECAEGEKAEWQSDEQETETKEGTGLAAGMGSDVSSPRSEGVQGQSQPPPPPYEEAHLYPTLYAGAKASVGTVRSSPLAIQVLPTCEDMPLSPVDAFAYLSVCNPAGSIVAASGCAGVGCALECRTSHLTSVASSITLTVLGSSLGDAELSASHMTKPTGNCKAAEHQSMWHKLWRVSMGLWRRMVRMH